METVEDLSVNYIGFKLNGYMSAARQSLTDGTIGVNVKFSNTGDGEVTAISYCSLLDALFLTGWTGSTES